MVIHGETPTCKKIGKTFLKSPHPTGHALPSHRHQATGDVSPHTGEARLRVRPGRDALGLGAQ